MAKAYSAEDVFRLYVIPTGFCWYWTGTISRGYGVLKRDGRTQPAHRWVYEYLIAPVPRYLKMDHLCRNKLCVNPDHVQPVSIAENTRRGLRSWRLSGTCRKGLHDVTNPANVYIRPDGQRQCRRCLYESNNRRRKERMLNE